MTRDKSVFFSRSELLPFVEMRRANRSGACYHTHSHDEFSFGVIDEGRAGYVNGRVRNRIGAGTTVTINPGDSHSCNPEDGAWSYRMLFVDSRWVGQLQQEMLNSHNQDYLAFPELLLSDSRSYSDFSRLFSCLLTETSPLAAESLLIGFLERCFLTSRKQSRPCEKPDGQRIRWVEELIMDQLDSNLTLAQFSEHSGLSRYHLIRSFKDKYGQSPHAFQLDQRIKKARLMLQTGRSLADTASQLGFADQSHFQRHFKKRVAVTPKQYQAFFL